MNFDSIRSGAVVVYPYLWNREAAKGETEGRKHRPSALAVRVARAGRADLVVLFPITTKAPDMGRWAVEVPETEKLRAGLDPMLRQWIVLDECNGDAIPGSFYLEPGPPLGHFSKRFFLPLVLEFVRRREPVTLVGLGE